MRRGSKPGSEHRRKFVAGGQRHHLLHRNQMAKMAQGREETPDGRHTGATLSVSPAAWLPAQMHVGDCEFMDDGLDDVLIRAVHDRVVYAGSVTCHRSMPFEDIAARAINAAVRGRVSNHKERMNGKADIKSVPRPVEEPKVDRDGYREGRSLAEVVSDLFNKEAA